MLCNRNLKDLSFSFESRVEKESFFFTFLNNFVQQVQILSLCRTFKVNFTNVIWEEGFEEFHFTLIVKVKLKLN